MWGFPKIRGTFFGGSHNKDYSILGSILGSPYFGKLPCRFGWDIKPLKSFHLRGPNLAGLLGLKES